MNEYSEYFDRFLKLDSCLADTVCLFIIRNSDKKIGLKKVDDCGWWLPYKEVHNGKTFKTVAEEILRETGVPSKIVGTLQLCNIQYHAKLPPAKRITFLAEIENILENSNSMSWFSTAELQNMAKKDLKSIEPLIICKNLNQVSLPVAEYSEYSVNTSIISTAQEIDNVPKSTQETLMESAGISAEGQKLLYYDFMHHVYPCETMNFDAFVKYLKSFGWWPEEILIRNAQSFFRAFDVNLTGHLTHREMMLGLAAMNQLTPHGGLPAELRCRYIFRYYDKNCDGILETSEFKSMIVDINALKEIQLDEKSLKEALSQHSKTFQLQGTAKLSLTNFLQTVGQLKFRGTSGLLRTPEPVIYAVFNRLGLTKVLQASPHKRRRQTSPVVLDSPIRRINGDVEDKTYDLATHSVKVRRSGALVDVNSLWDMEGTSALSGTVKFPSKMRIERVSSVDSFNLQSQANEMLYGLSYFEHSIKKETAPNRTPKEAFSWGNTNSDQLARCILNICRTVYDIFNQEDRLLRINSPAYVLGDIHGNFSDLICFEKTLWRMGPILTPASFLFLGDYVDRGEHGVEVITYLFSQKILAPQKFLLLRGNHEVRSVQQMFTFHRECLTKFGEKYGMEIWGAINECFDSMPLAAVIDEKVFCVHGGIPPPWLMKSLNDINAILKPLPNPEQESALAWELMWNDPINTDQLNSNLEKQLKEKEGFLPNSKRGTGHMFSTDGLENFLNSNGLSYVIRAHEVQQAGFKVQLNGKLLTVFSSSKYCGGSNEAACILADRRKLRTIRLDTS